MIRKFKNTVHGVQATLATTLYGFPSRKIFTIGVTGTDGKTTTSSLIFHILKTAEKNPALISTVGAQIGNQEFDTGFHTTTPSPFSVQKYVSQAVKAGCEYLVLEVTSHALDQNRVKGIDFKLGVLTNITHEHLDYHGTYENYVKAKARLFQKAGIVLLNKDDDSFEKVKSYCKGKQVLAYSLKKDVDFNLKNVKIKIPEQFEFNSENFLAAVAVAKLLGITDEKIMLALASYKFPQGRQEVVYDEDFRVIIDFAHTPNSFARILPALKKITKGRLIHVFGAAAKRDMSKRPLMGELSAQNADVIILTAEDSRDEDISKINEQIKMGIRKTRHSGLDPESQEILNPNFAKATLGKQVQDDKNGKYVFEIHNRQEAVDFAIKIAQKGDVVVMTGKGHEKSMNLGRGEIAWSEHEAVEKSLKKRLGTS